jgi:putative mRNA 3-end processing factor
MILPDFITLTDKGLYCKAGSFYLDPLAPVETAVISHAHGDHAVAGNANVYCTSETAALMRLRLRKNPAGAFAEVPYRLPFRLGEVSLQLFPAGHILGSAMILMVHQGIRYLYTGDFKLAPDPTCEAAELVRADVLITETTFADPGVLHPDPVTEIRKLNASGHNVLLGAYALGKSQRLISLINAHCPSRKVLVHHNILPVVRLYEELSGIRLACEPYNRKLMKNPGSGFVYIVPPLTFDSYFRAKGVMRVFASGWKRLQRNNDLELYISDHADWNELLEAIRICSPSEIWTLHGDGRYLKEHFSETLPVKILA